MRDNFNKDENLYEALGFPKDYKSSDISAADLKAGQRKIIKEFHPDVVRAQSQKDGITGEALDKLVKDATEKIQRVNAAYDVLKDPNKRKRYDEFVEYGTRKSGASGFRSGSSTHHANTDANKAGANKAGGNTGGQTGGRKFNEDFWSDFGQYSRHKYQDFYENLKQEISKARAAGKRPNLEGYDFSFRDLSGMDLEGCIFPKHTPIYGANFNGANLKDASFSFTTMMDCKFDHATKLDGAKFIKTFFIGEINLPKKLTNVDFRGVNFSSKTVLEGIHFENCLFDEAHLKMRQIKDCVIKGGSMKELHGGFSKFTNVELDNVDIKNAKLLYVELEDVTFKNMNFDGLDLSKASLKNVKFEGPLKGLKLAEHHLPHIDFSKADKTGLKVVNILDREIPISITKEGKVVSRNSDPLRKLEHDITGDFFRTDKGALRFGRVAAVSAAVIGAGAVLYYLQNKESQKNQPLADTKPDSWTGKVRTMQSAAHPAL